MSEQKPILLSGIKPTGEIHLGNYFGAMRQQVDLFKSGKYDCHIFVADYHALTSLRDAKEMQNRIIELTAAYIAVGLDPEQVVLFKQSDVPAHTELAWIFDTITTMPYLMRSHAFKASIDRAKQLLESHLEQKKQIAADDQTQAMAFAGEGAALDYAYEEVLRSMHDINVGTFNYPMLMAADILLYDATLVPVGQDQKQHIEYARDTAEKFNRTFGTTFRLPEAYILPEVAVIPGIDGQKMSKSYGNVIPLFASTEVIREKVMGIITDSGSDRPENVYAIHRRLVNKENGITEAELADVYTSLKGNYKAIKERLVEDLDRFVAPMREKYESLMQDPAAIMQILEEGGVKARERADAKMEQVRKAVGVA